MAERKYSVIVFDLGNVLIPFDYSVALDKLDKIDKDLGKKFWKFYEYNYSVHRGFERGDIPEKEFLGTMLSALENKVDERTFCEYYSKVFRVNEEVAALLPLLKQKYMLVLLSNTNSIHRECGWKDYDFLKYFDKLILSYEVNSLKPEEKIYRSVESFTNKPPAEHIFIDDVEEYAEGARRCGWDAIHFQGYQQLIKELREKNII